MSESQQPAAEFSADPALLAARPQARAALAEVTEASAIGTDAGHEVQGKHLLTLHFECTLAGYPGWQWAATVARVDEDSPVTVLEVELLPGAGALVAPEWVPWSQRMSQYRDSQAKLAEAGLLGAATGDEQLEGSGLNDIDEDEVDEDEVDLDDTDLDDSELDDVDETDEDDDLEDDDLDDDADETSLFDDDDDAEVDGDDIDDGDPDDADGSDDE